MLIQDLGQKRNIGVAELGNMAFLYKITNTITKKSYIGWTGKTVEGRWKTHKTDALKNKENRKFYNSIRKYGTECWIVETLCEVSTIVEAKLKEIEFIAFFDSYNYGYNSTKGGDGNNGIIMSSESNHKRSIALKGKAKNYDRMKDKEHSEETKQKISKSHIGKKKPWVTWNKNQIEKRAMTRRSITLEQFNKMHLLRKQGLLIKEIAKEVNLSNDMVKKWLKKEWTL